MKLSSYQIVFWVCFFAFILSDSLNRFCIYTDVFECGNAGVLICFITDIISVTMSVLLSSLQFPHGKTGSQYVPLRMKIQSPKEQYQR